MIRITELRLPVNHAPEELEVAILKRLSISSKDLVEFTVFKRSHDARKNTALSFIYTIDLSIKDEDKVLKKWGHDPHIRPSPDTSYHYVAKAPQDLKKRPVVIGFGPCGIFAALILAQMGFKPIVLERGKQVRERTQDTWGLWRKKILNPESNVQFGEGGAGTFSDGKLYSQIKDPRHLGRKVMQEFVRFGAPEDILFAAHPHIGTFKLVKEIIRLGGEVRFEQRVVDIEYEASSHHTTASNLDKQASQHVVALRIQEDRI